MPRTKNAGGGETEALFPELEKDNPEHKALLKLARDFNKKKKAHAEGIATLKETRDSAELRLLSKMHECKLPGFKYDGVHVKIELGREKAEIHIEHEGDEESEEESAE